MTNLAKLKSDRAQDAELRQMRVDLAAAFRLAAAMNWHESVGNHFSLAVSPDGKKFLMNPRWKHFSLIRASDLLLLDSEDPATMTRADAPDPSAWCIHGRIHANLAHARCLLHLHPPYATALAALADPELKPIDQNTARFYNRMAIDLGYAGLADDKAVVEVMALELRNSLTTISGYAQQLAANRDPELTHRLAADIAAEAAHLDSTIGGFLAGARAAAAAEA